MDITFRAVTTDDLQFLYDMLAERPAYVNISHRAMPTWEEHCRFVNSRPYKKWYIIWSVRDDSGIPSGMERIGNIYLTAHNEIGIFIKDAHQGRMFGRTAVIRLMAEDKTIEYIANIAPTNSRSIKMFQGLDFEVIQTTLRSKPWVSTSTVNSVPSVDTAVES